MPTTLSRWIQSARVLHRGEAAHRVLGEARRDRRVGAVAEQPQGDVHPDLRAATREQGALAGEVGALVALGVRAGRAVRAEPVVERVDERVVVLADVAAARVDQLARERAGRVGHQGDSLGLVVDAHRRSRGRRLDDLPVGLALGPRLGVAPVLLEPLVHQRRGALQGLEVGVVDVERGCQGEHAHGRRDVLGVEPCIARPSRVSSSVARSHSPRKGTRSPGAPRSRPARRTAPDAAATRSHEARVTTARARRLQVPRATCGPGCRRGDSAPVRRPGQRGAGRSVSSSVAGLTASVTCDVLAGAAADDRQRWSCRRRSSRGSARRGRSRSRPAGRRRR